MFFGCLVIGRFTLKRTHNCNVLSRDDIGSTVILNGWVHRRRDHGGLIFIDLRDRYGLTQIVFNPELHPDSHEMAGDLRIEYVVAVRGMVAERPSGTINESIATGQVELLAQELQILSKSKTPPFYINEEQDVDESLRLRYRYLDLRRDKQKNNIILRHRVVKFMRDFLDTADFVEIETPILVKSTPEGARDFLVPSRLRPGQFYALPQSPQQMKQLLMIAGLDRYFQIARAFRDEDPRADRVVEHTQLDIEMSFVEESDVMGLIEKLFLKIVAEFSEMSVVSDGIPQLNYEDAMARYGTDRPDLRFGLELIDLTDICSATGFRAFDETTASGGIIKAVVAPGCSTYSRKQTDVFIEEARRNGAKGAITVASYGGEYKSSLQKFLDDDLFNMIIERLGLQDGDLALIVADETRVTNAALDGIRRTIADQLELRSPDEIAFCWIKEFPLLDRVEGQDRLTFSHNPFCGIKPGDEALLDTDPLRAKSRQYDLVCNGSEVGGGSIRITNGELQRRIFELLGYSAEEIEHNFGSILQAFDFGVPPHGGIAMGIDRLLMILCRTDNIREVVAFPKTQDGQDLAQAAPSAVTDSQLAELHIKVVEQESGD